MKNNYDGISVIIPMYGDLKINTKSVFSAATQCLGKLNEAHPRVEIIIMADDIEYQREHNGKSEFDYFLSKEFRQLYDTDNVDIKVIHNLEKFGSHIYQGGGRLFGMEIAKYSFCILFDSDDILAPLTVRMYWDIIQKELVNKNTKKNIYKIGGSFISFDSNGYYNEINKSIWVQEYCYNSDFFSKFKLNDATIYTHKVNRKQGEDYLMCQIADYTYEHNMDKWIAINIDDIGIGYWIPNYDSLSRRDPYYGQHLSGSTMNSSNTILDYMEYYNKKHKIVDKEDEIFKHRVLNMTIYGYFNLFDFLKTVGIGKYSDNPYIPLEEDWELLVHNVAKLRMRLLKYYNEIQYADIEDQLYATRHMSDCRCCNVWEGSFYDFMDGKDNMMNILNMDYKAMMDYCKELKFDNGAVNEIHSKQAMAWNERHKD